MLFRSGAYAYSGRDNGDDSAAEGYCRHRLSDAGVYAALQVCPQPEGQAVQPGAGGIVFFGLLVSFFHCLLPVCGSVPRAEQYVREPDDDCAGDAVALFLYVYHSSGGGDQFLF